MNRRAPTEQEAVIVRLLLYLETLIDGRRQVGYLHAADEAGVASLARNYRILEAKWSDKHNKYLITFSLTEMARYVEHVARQNGVTAREDGTFGLCDGSYCTAEDAVK